MKSFLYLQPQSSQNPVSKIKATVFLGIVGLITYLVIIANKCCQCQHYYGPGAFYIPAERCESDMSDSEMK